MVKTSKRLLSVLLVIVLIFSMAVNAFAAEIDETKVPEPVGTETMEPEPDSTEGIELPTEETAEPAQEATETTEPETPSELPENEDDIPVEATEATEDTETTEPEETLEPEEDSEPVVDKALAEYGFVSDVIEQKIVGLEEPVMMLQDMTRSYAKTATLIDCEQMDMMTNDGNRLGFHIADEDGKMPWDYMNLIYCLESNKAFSYGSGHEGSGDVPIDGDAQRYGERVWYNLSYDQRVAIGLVLLYGAPTKLWDYGWGINPSGKHDMHNPNIGYRFATQALIWEIADGKRQAAYPYGRNDSHWYDLAVGKCTSADGGTDHFVYAYNAIVADMQTHNVIPSFTGAAENTAPEIALTGNAAILTDTNGVLPRFTFTNKDNVSFSKNGNVLTVSASANMSGVVHKATATMASPQGSLYEVWYNQFNSSRQTCIKVSTPATAPVSAYFKLKASTGSLALKKSTEDGKNLGGWQFSLYADEACTRLISGPYTTDNAGDLLVKDLAAGEVWVKEIGHKDAAIHALYHCKSVNPQKVTIRSGSTASVSFYNALNNGFCKIVKSLSNPEAGTVEGWVFDIHKVLADGRLEYLATVTSGADGTIQKELPPGTYQVTEKLAADSLWQCTSELSKTVTVEPGKTATVSFINAVRPGEIRVEKVNTYGEPLHGVVFLLEWSTDGKSWAPVSYTDSTIPQVGTCTTQGLSDGKLASDSAGELVYGGLHPMLYYRLSEVATLNGYELLTGYAYQGMIPADKGLSIKLRVVNAPSFTLPETGGNAFAYLPYASLILCSSLLLASWVSYKGKKNNEQETQ